MFGATTIERHVTLDHKMWGSDHACSLEVHAMDMLRKRIISARESIGNPIKKVFEAEGSEDHFDEFEDDYSTDDYEHLDFDENWN